MKGIVSWAWVVKTSIRLKPVNKGRNLVMAHHPLVYSFLL
ncbi:hypothetical protein CHISP_2286 [Chitinispirillum alkaliphilum]|nr:hypothetical protein CHISP_2286 [Chitinispirillum alkaliphilum]